MSKLYERVSIETFIGKTFGHLTVLRLVSGVNPVRLDYRTFYNTPLWCRCSCGKEKAVRVGHLIQKHCPVVSCGCVTNRVKANNTSIERHDQKLINAVDEMLARQLQ